MAGITQQVPNYIFGISEQPDELKIPGQVKNLKNGLPDVTRGLQKRPGSNYVNTLSAESNSKWFHIFRDEAEQYIGQVTKAGAVAGTNGAAIRNGTLPTGTLSRNVHLYPPQFVR